MRFTLTEALCAFWEAWDHKTKAKLPLPGHMHKALNALTDFVIREIAYRSDAPHYIPSPLQNFKNLYV